MEISTTRYAMQLVGPLCGTSCLTKQLSIRRALLLIICACLYVNLTHLQTASQQVIPRERKMHYTDNNLVNTRPMRTLVILSGNLRGGELAWESFYRNVLDNNPNTDLALLLDNSGAQNYPNASLIHRAKYIWPVPKFDDWADAMDLIAHGRKDWREKVLKIYYRDGGNILLGGADNIRGSGALIFMHRWFLTQRLLIDNIWQQYTHFYVTRTDLFYMCPINFTFLVELDDDAMWVPQGEDYGGLCDRAFFGPTQYVFPALNILPPLVYHPENYTDVLTATAYNTEQFVKRRWEEQGLKVRRFARMMFISATDRDGSGWQKPNKKVVEGGVHYKYVNEYKRGIATCRGIAALRAQYPGNQDIVDDTVSFHNFVKTRTLTIINSKNAT